MQNIYELLKAIGVEIPTDKKADFDKSVAENYKTIAEVEKINAKLTKANDDLTATKESLDTMTTEFETLKANNATADDFKKKYDDLVAENTRKEEERKAAEIEAATRAEFDNYFAENKKEWNNPFIADGYYNKYKEARAASEYKGKTTADILSALTKDDATAFKGTQPNVTLKGTEPIGGTQNRLNEIYKNNPFYKGV